MEVQACQALPALVTPALSTREFDPMPVEVETSQALLGGVPASTTPTSSARDDWGGSDQAAEQVRCSGMVEAKLATLTQLRVSSVPSAPAVGVCDAAAPTTSSSSQEAIEGAICLPLQTPLLKKLCLRRSRTPVSRGVLRRSGSLASKVRAANATRQAHNVILKKMGIAVEEGAPNSEVKAKFRGLVCGARDMPNKKREMFQTVLGGHIDFSMVELELDGLEEEDL